jgi:hypothetical protein
MQHTALVVDSLAEGALYGRNIPSVDAQRLNI